MNPGNDLRDFVRNLDRSGQLVRVRELVNPRFQVAERIYECQKSTNKPIFFENVAGYDIPIVSNVLPSRLVASWVLQVPKDQVLNEWIQREKHPRRKREVADGPCKERILIGEKADLRDLPIVTHCMEDGGPYITAGILIFKKQGDVANASFNRMQLRGKRKVRIDIDPWGVSHAGICHRENEKKGKALEVAVCIGNHPHIMLAAAAKIPMSDDELDFAGAVRKRPVDVVRCETVDVDVPADTEIVIEGRILPSLREREGPFGDFLGYYERYDERPVLDVTAVTSRSKPIYQTILATGLEHAALYLPTEAEIYKALKARGLSVMNVRLSSSPSHYVVSIRKRNEEEPFIAIREAFKIAPWVRMCTVVDDDVDISNNTDVLWAISTRLNPKSGILVKGDQDDAARGFDPALGTFTEEDKFGLDATVPLNEKEKWKRAKVGGPRK